MTWLLTWQSQVRTSTHSRPGFLLSYWECLPSISEMESWTLYVKYQSSNKGQWNAFSALVWMSIGSLWLCLWSSTRSVYVHYVIPALLIDNWLETQKNKHWANYTRFRKNKLSITCMCVYPPRYVFIQTQFQGMWCSFGMKNSWSLLLYLV